MKARENTIVDLEKEYCDLISQIVWKLTYLGFKARKDAQLGLYWVIDRNDTEHPVMALAAADQEGYCMAEIMKDLIYIDTKDDEKVINIDYMQDNAAVVRGFSLDDLPFLRYVPKVLDLLEKDYDNRLGEYLERLKRQPDFSSLEDKERKALGKNKEDLHESGNE